MKVAEGLPTVRSHAFHKEGGEGGKSWTSRTDDKQGNGSCQKPFTFNVVWFKTDPPTTTIHI